ncbi:sperm-associated antigen 16 protein isoform X2 [Pogoniulus pusillus]|uniref:sperm-associated antigen 16 protein isoform X2 n=1 Tax=Pogoniulus pusillus TaxID=488313 RepID=UPI0030B950B1
MEPAAAGGSEEAFCLQKLTITDDSTDDYQYEEVPTDDEFSLEEEDDEDLSKALQTIQEQAEDARILALQSVLTSDKSVSEIPGTTDDFFCNFLVRMGMSRTLDCFQTEWYELVERGVVKVEDAGLVPSVYTRNQQLEDENMQLRKDLENYKLAAKLKAHCASYEPLLKQLTEKYQTILRQKTLTSLERDRAVEQLTGLQAKLQNFESIHALQIPVTKVGHKCQMKEGLEGPTQKALREARQKNKILGAENSSPVKDERKRIGKRYPKGIIGN